MVKKADRELMEINRRYWNEVVPVHAGSEMYNLAGFMSGDLSLDELERSEVGEVGGKQLLHLQCHFGLDTLSWARLGARVTGMDYAPDAIAKARALAAECGIEARFICSNLYDLPQQLEGQFDIVFTSYGVLCWLPDLREWARIAASYVRPGGFFYIAEFHPFSYVFDDEAGELKYRYPYFAREALRFEFDGTYADKDAKLQNREDYEWAYRMGDVVTALIEAGLRIEFLHEHAFTVYEQLPFLVKAEKGRWRFPGGAKPIPLMFSLKAGKPLE
ncbi:MAG TPA: class I SAM-dependent methyltransferase [Anaerolineaceae bacterium]|nr:class I SAM-dependent methyltransferase [Anaerolineaceae bacterium]